MRPKIICHMVSSIDGRLLPDRWTPTARGVASDLASRLYEKAAAGFRADGWIVGRKTIAEMADGRPWRGPAGSAKGLRDTFVAPRQGRDVAVAIDPKGKVHYRKDNVGGDHVVAVLGEQVAGRYLAGLRERGISYLLAGRDGRDLKRAMDILGSDFQLKTLLLEGGGGINGSFLKAGLIDEISVLVYPGIDGLSGVPSIFEYAGRPGEKPAKGRALRHLATRTLEGGAVWLRYAVEPPPRGR